MNPQHTEPKILPHCSYIETQLQSSSGLILQVKYASIDNVNIHIITTDVMVYWI